MKILKSMNLLNGLYSFACILSILFSLIGFLSDALVWYNTSGMVLTCVTLLPFGPVAWLVGLIHYIANRRKTDYEDSSGQKLRWLIIWFIVVPILWIGAVFTLTSLSGGV